MGEKIQSRKKFTMSIKNLRYTTLKCMREDVLAFHVKEFDDIVISADREYNIKRVECFCIGSPNLQEPGITAYSATAYSGTYDVSLPEGGLKYVLQTGEKFDIDLPISDWHPLTAEEKVFEVKRHPESSRAQIPLYQVTLHLEVVA